MGDVNGDELADLLVSTRYYGSDGKRTGVLFTFYWGAKIFQR